MADFKTHITVSTTLGVGYAAVAFRYFDVPPPTCALAGALCSVSGMLPDLDSDSGVPLRESLAFAAACIPVMLLPRFEHLNWPSETIILAGAAIYAVVRFGLGKLLKKYTVHRGMFHSIPAALIAGEVAFLLCATGDIYIRAYKACAVLLGFFSHLILDEIWSVRLSGGTIGLKSSSGTAMKLWGDSAWANLSCYGKLVLLGVLVLNDPIWTSVSPQGAELHSVAANVVQQFESRTNFQIPKSFLPSAGGAGSAAQQQGNTAQQFNTVPQQNNMPQGVDPRYRPPPAGYPQYAQPQGYAPNYAPNYSAPTYPQGYAPTYPPQNYVPQNYAPPGYPPQNMPPQPQQPAPAAGMPLDPRVQYGPMTRRY